MSTFHSFSLSVIRVHFFLFCNDNFADNGFWNSCNPLHSTIFEIFKMERFLKVRFLVEILLTMKNGCGIASAAVVPENRTLAP